MNSHDNRAAVNVDRDVAGRPRAMPLTCQHFEQTDAAIASGTPLGEEEPPFPEDHIESTGYWTNQAQHDKEELPFPDAYSEPHRCGQSLCRHRRVTQGSGRTTRFR